jgi:hypothetical protein
VSDGVHVIVDDVPEATMAGDEGNGEENHATEKWKNEIISKRKLRE